MNPDTESKRLGSSRQKTSCFVHSLLESHARSTNGTPNQEGLAQHSPQDKGAGSDGTGSSTPDSRVEGHTQSRLLTKKQLSDMAVGIRELSKKLGHIRLKLKVRNGTTHRRAASESEQKGRKGKEGERDEE